MVCPFPGGGHGRGTRPTVKVWGKEDSLMQATVDSMKDGKGEKIYCVVECLAIWFYQVWEVYLFIKMHISSFLTIYLLFGH